MSFSKKNVHEHVLEETFEYALVQRGGVTYKRKIKMRQCTVAKCEYSEAYDMVEA